MNWDNHIESEINGEYVWGGGKDEACGDQTQHSIGRIVVNLSWSKPIMQIITIKEGIRYILYCEDHCSAGLVCPEEAAAVEEARTTTLLERAMRGAMAKGETEEEAPNLGILASNSLEENRCMVVYEDLQQLDVMHNNTRNAQQQLAREGEGTKTRTPSSFIISRHYG